MPFLHLYFFKKNSLKSAFFSVMFFLTMLSINAQQDVKTLDSLFLVGKENIFSSTEKSIAIFKSIIEGEHTDDTIDLKYNTTVYLSKVYYNFAKYDSSQYYNNRVIKLTKQRNDSLNLSYALLLKGMIFENKGDFANAIKYHLEALKYSGGNLIRKSQVYQGLAYLVDERGEHANAKEYLEEALKYSKEAMSIDDMALVLVSLVNVSLINNEIDEAICYLQEANSFLVKSNLIGELQENFHTSYARYYKAIKDYPNALKQVGIGMNLGGGKGKFIPSARIICLRASIYLEMGDFKKAEKYYGLALESAIASNSKTMQADVYLELSEYYHQIRDFENAQKYLKLYFEIDKEMRQRENSTLFSSLVRQFKEADKEKEIISQKLKLEQIKAESSVMQQYIVLGFVLVMILGLVVWVFILKRKNTSLEIAEAKAFQIAEAKTKFLSVMTHELRTPLYTMSGSLELLKKSTSLNESTSIIRDLSFSVDYFKNFIENSILLKEFEERGKSSNFFVDEEVCFDLHALLDYICFAVRYMENNNKITLQIDKKIPKDLKGVKLHLSQLLINLIGNSQKFTENGIIKLEVEKIKENGNKVNLRFTVTDTGNGVEAEELNEIFKPFYSGKKYANQSYLGMGLGLSLVKEILSKYDEVLSFESVIGQGSMASFELQFEISTPEDKPSIAKNAGVEGYKVKILIAEDNKINQQISKKIAESLGYICDVAQNGEDAYQKYRSNDYDLVLMDLMMPVLDGFESSLKISSLDVKAKIIAVSAMNETEDLEAKMKAHHMRAFLSKPFNSDQLRQLIESTLH